MTLLDLKVICIKNVSRNNDALFTKENYYSFNNSPLYADYINNIDIDINQALSRIVTADVLPSISEKVKKEAIVEDLGLYLKIDTKSLEKPLYRVKKVYFKPQYGGLIHPEYSKIDSDYLLVSKLTVPGEYIIVYSINIGYLTDDSVDLKEDFGIDDTLINSFVVPFVKAKLWEAEEPGLAQQYMNYAETYLASYSNHEDHIFQDGIQMDYWY